MLEQLTGWNSLRDRGFTGQEAALAMVGRPNTKDPEALCNAAPALELMRSTYEGTRRWFADAPEGSATAPRGLLVSVDMQAAQGRTSAELAAVAGDVRFLTWLRTPIGDFDRQTFSREVLARWVLEVGATSLYAFTEQAPQAEPVEIDCASGSTPDAELPWWRVFYDIPDMAQNIGAKLQSETRQPSNIAIAKRIEARINEIERSSGRDRKAPSWDTIRGVLTGWRWRRQ